MKTKIIIIFFLFIDGIQLKAQDSTVYYPKIGEKIIDHTFTDILNFSGKSLKISDYKGKWLILDFWTKYCAGCIASFAKMDKLSREFNGKATIMMVGITHRLGTVNSDEKLTKSIFSSRVKRYGYILPSAFDSSAGANFDIYGVPTIFIINPEGILVGKSAELNSDILSTFIRGETPNYRRSYSIHETPPTIKWTPGVPLLMQGNGGPDTSFLSRSVFAKWNKSMPEGVVNGFNLHDINGMPKPGHAEAYGLDLPELFRLAYTGYAIWDDEDELYNNLSRKLILNVKDTSSFKINKGRRNSQNAYAYSLILNNGKTDVNLIRESLLEDLHRYFRLKSEIQIRKVEIYKLVVIDQKKVMKLRSKGGTTGSRINTDRLGFTLTNYPFKKFLAIAHLNEGLNAKYEFDMGSVPPIFDETNLDINIDFQFNADHLDWNASLDILRANGLDLIKAEKEMKCIVISDAE